jgi:iron complex outermembrane receptor protein
MNKQTITLFLTAIAFLMPALSLSAQSADGTISVVVTADRTETEETKTSAMVTIITAEEIADSGAADIPALLEALPGVQFRSYSGPAEAQISMGGFGENSFGRVVVLVNGRRLNNPDMSGINWQSIPVDSIERIEVLHGGGSVLYGNGAIGGVVNIITRKAVEPFSLTASSSWGSFKTFKEAFSLGLSSEAGELRIGGDWYLTDGHRDRTGQQSAHATLGGSLYPSDRLALGLDLAYSFNFYEMPGGLTEAQFEDDPTQAVNQEDESTEHALSADLSSEYALGDSASLDVLVGYEYKNFAPDMVSFWPSGSFTDRLYNTLSLNTKLNIGTALSGTPINIVSGIDSQYTGLEIIDYDSLDRDNQIDRTEVEFIALGAYVDTDVELSDRSGFSAGFRIDGANITDGDADKWHFGPAWSAALRFNPDSNYKLYLRHERTFRYPFTDEQITSGTFLEDLEAEHGYLFETGAMIRIRELARIDSRAYVNLMQDEIAYVGFFPAGQNENIDNTRRIGGEVKVEFDLSDAILIKGSYGYVLPTFTNGDNEGNQIPLVSNHEAEGSVNVSLPFSFETEAGVSYRGEAFQGGDSANSAQKMDPYVLVNAAIRWKQELGKGNIALSGAIDNILDLTYAPYMTYSYYYYPAPGRSFTLSGSYTY